MSVSAGGSRVSRGAVRKRGDRYSDTRHTPASRRSRIEFYEHRRSDHHPAAIDRATRDLSLSAGGRHSRDAARWRRRCADRVDTRRQLWRPLSHVGQTARFLLSDDRAARRASVEQPVRKMACRRTLRLPCGGGRTFRTDAAAASALYLSEPFRELVAVRADRPPLHPTLGAALDQERRHPAPAAPRSEDGAGVHPPFRGSATVEFY